MIAWDAEDAFLRDASGANQFVKKAPYEVIFLLLTGEREITSGKDEIKR